MHGANSACGDASQANRQGRFASLAGLAGVRLIKKESRQSAYPRPFMFTFIWMSSTRSITAEDIAGLLCQRRHRLSHGQADGLQPCTHSIHSFRLPPPLQFRLQSGIDISDELLGLYEEVKLRHKHKYFIFSLKQMGSEGNKTVWGWEINHKSEPVSDDKNIEAFSEVVKQLPTDEARFVVFDFVDTKADGRQIKKLVLIKWCVLY